MNTTYCLTQAIMIAATLAAGFVAQASDSAAVATPVVVMDTVQITGKRLNGTDMAVVQLPRVEITGKRSMGSQTQLAQKNLRGTTPKSVAPV